MIKKMGFAEGWMKFATMCFIYSLMSILINDGQTRDFKVGKGLRQDDLLDIWLLAAFWQNKYSSRLWYEMFQHWNLILIV
jgi:hypothetical protein